ncbi:hypothetical protein NEIRO02_2227 [Nematocida sp. AWRm79]|nr:hypothetical protein NEIRO02_2227 [Nematocida sp. AWRm79]
MIIKLLLVMYTVYARLELSDIKEIGETKVVQKDNLLIHPDGSLNLLRGYIMHKSGYMYNKRFYSSEINTLYKLEKTNEVSDNGWLIFNHTRNPVKDMAYDDICEEKEKNEYLKQFHTQLIKMFPSVDGSLSIVSGLSEGFTSFLIKDEVQPQSMYILAALFLLSERVDIPINVEEKKLILKSADKATTYIDQSLHIYTKDQTESKNDLKKWCKDIECLIKFLKKYIDNDSANPSAIKELPTVPTTYEEFETGEFLNTPQFLVQSYIYEFIDTKDKYIEFIEAVYALLNDQVKNEKSTEKNKARCNELLRRLFIEESKLSNVTDHTKHICDLNETIEAFRVCPFIDKTEIPVYTRVKAYNRENNKEIDDEKKKYSNCVEVGILGLMCCLVYDPEERTYNTDHLPNNEETKPLKDFFRKYPKPRETTSYEMQQNWCRVVADLKTDKILYKREGDNELPSSLLNILYVVSDITGNKEEVVKEIKYIEESYRSKKPGEQLDIEESLNSIFTSLSNNKNLEVESSGFTISMREDKKPYLFGNFCLLYTFGEIKSGILLGINSHHTQLDIAENSLFNEYIEVIKKTLTEIQNVYTDINGYTGYVIKHYIDITMHTLGVSDMYLSYPIEGKILDSICAGGSDGLRLFLFGRIESNKYKAHIVKLFLMCYARKSQNGSTLIRMTDNIIGSAPLDDCYTRIDILSGYVYNPAAREYYTKIDESAWDEMNVNKHPALPSLFKYLYKYNDGFDVINWAY